MTKKTTKKSQSIKKISIGGKTIVIGKDSVRSSAGGSFQELVKGLKRLSKKNIFEYSFD